MCIAFDLVILLLEIIKQAPKDARSKMYMKMLVMIWTEGGTFEMPYNTALAEYLWRVPTMENYALVYQQLSWFNWICFCVLTQRPPHPQPPHTHTTGRSMKIGTVPVVLLTVS